MTIRRSKSHVLRCRVISDISCALTTAESEFNSDVGVMKRKKSYSGLKAAAAATSAAATHVVAAAAATTTAVTGEVDNSHIVGHINEDGSIEPGNECND